MKLESSDKKMIDYICVCGVWGGRWGGGIYIYVCVCVSVCVCVRMGTYNICVYVSVWVCQAMLNSPKNYEPY